MVAHYQVQYNLFFLSNHIRFVELDAQFIQHWKAGKQPMKKSTPLSTVFILIGIVLAGCGGGAIQVHAVQAVASENPSSKEELEIYNCDRQTDLHRSLAEETQVTCTTAISSAASTASGDTLVIPEELKADLAAQIEQTYLKNKEEAEAKVSQMDLLVPVGKIRTYAITWKQEVYASTIAFRYNDIRYTAAYTYTVNIPGATIATEISCTG